MNGQQNSRLFRVKPLKFSNEAGTHWHWALGRETFNGLLLNHQLSGSPMLQKLLALFLVLILVGCGDGLNRSPIAHASRDPQHGYEIQLDFSYRSMGGPCNFPQMPHRVSESHWIYTDRIAGQVPTNHLILTYERGKTEYPWPQEALRGTVTFANGHMHIDLQTPIFADGTNVSGYAPYRLNGDYKLEIK